MLFFLQSTNIFFPAILKRILYLWKNINNVHISAISARILVEHVSWCYKQISYLTFGLLQLIYIKGKCFNAIFNITINIKVLIPVSNIMEFHLIFSCNIGVAMWKFISLSVYIIFSKELHIYCTLCAIKMVFFFGLFKYSLDYLEQLGPNYYLKNSNSFTVLTH